MPKHGLTFLLCLVLLAVLHRAVPVSSSFSGLVLQKRAFLPLVIGEPPAWLGPEGGIVVCLTADPVHPAVLYAGSWGGGVFKSMDAGVTWNAINDGLGNLFINALAVDPLAPATLYAGTYKDKVYKSQNGGLTWFASSSGIQAEAVTYALAVDPKIPGVVYAGTRGISNDGAAPWNGVLYKSTDGGATWAAKLQNIGGTDQQDWVYSLSINPNSPSIVYAASHEHGPFRSDDRGETWFAVTNGISDGSGRAIAVDPQNSATVYLGVWHRSGVFKTVNGGGSWILEENGIADSKIFNLVVDPAQPSTIYIATANQGVMKTTNGGFTWLPAGSGLPTIYGLLVDAANHQRVFSGAAGAGLWLSMDSGANWQPSQEGLNASLVTALVPQPTDAKTIFVGTSGRGVLKSANRGATWSDFNFGLGDLYVNNLLIHPANANVFYALTQSGGLYRGDRSTTLGWQRIGTNLPMLSTTAVLAETHPFASLEAAFSPDEVEQDTMTYAPLITLAFAPSNTRVMYLGSIGAGLHKSQDEGVTWQSAGFSGQTVQAIAVDPVNPSLLWAASTEPGGLKYSTNGGGGWLDGGLSGVVVYALKRSASGTLFAGTSNGIYMRAASTWQWLGLPAVSVTALAFHPTQPQTILAGTTDGVWISTNTGSSWVRGSTALRFHTISDIDFDVNDPARVYFSTRGHGILQSNVPLP